MTEFQAYSDKCTAYGATPRAAAENFYSQFPNKRKCNITEGVRNGGFFTVAYNRDKWPRSYKDVTKKAAKELPTE